jgi:hypothetical protein
MKTVKSSNIRAVGYDPEIKVLAVEFSSGGVYHYPDIEPHHHEAMIGADSVGGYFHKHIKGKPFTKK